MVVLVRFSSSLTPRISSIKQADHLSAVLPLTKLKLCPASSDPHIETNPGVYPLLRLHLVRTLEKPYSSWPVTSMFDILVFQPSG